MTLTLIIAAAFTAGWIGCRMKYHHDHRRLAVEQLRFANATAAARTPRSDHRQLRLITRRETR